MRLGDDRERLRALRADAIEGEPRAQRHLANRYLRGQGIERDLAQAVYWMKRAAEAGLPPAQRSYGEFLEQGITGQADLLAARHWFRLAAAQGDPIARKHLERLKKQK